MREASTSYDGGYGEGLEADGLEEGFDLGTGEEGFDPALGDGFPAVGGAEEEAEDHAARGGIAAGHNVFDEGGFGIMAVLQENGEDGGERLGGRARLAQFGDSGGSGERDHFVGLAQVNFGGEHAVGMGGGHGERAADADALDEEENGAGDEFGSVHDLRRGVGERGLGAHGADDGGFVLVAQGEQERGDARGAAKFERIGADGGQAAFLGEMGEGLLGGFVAVGFRLVPVGAPAPGEIVHDEVAAAGVERFHQDEGLVTVMGLRAAFLADVITAFRRGEQIGDAAEAAR